MALAYTPAQPTPPPKAADHDAHPPAAPPPPAWVPALVLVAGGSVTALGLVVMLGWSLRQLTLISGLSTAAPMVVNTALSFIVCGVALLALTRGWRRLPQVAGGMVTSRRVNISFTSTWESTRHW
jgi:hypothetical protein